MNNYSNFKILIVDDNHDNLYTLRQLIENHLAYTDSDVAGEILDNWDQYLPKFVKVMPVEYRRALLEMQAQQEAKVA